VADPLASLPEPSAPGSCYLTDFNSGSGTLLPANRTYCGKFILNGSGNFQLQPGLYYFQNATVK